MLYNNFIICMMTCAFIALLHMIVDQDWQYIILPIGILIWGAFKFFDEDDREYLRRRGIDPDEYSVFFPNDYERYPINTSSTQKQHGNTIIWDKEDNFDANLFGGTTKDHTRYQPRTVGNMINGWQDPRYKGMVKKMKRNFKITISENKNDGKDETKDRKTVFSSVSSFGCC